MEKEQFNEVKARLQKMTPLLINGAVEVFENDPELVARFGISLREVAKQSVITLRDVLLGSLQLDHPQLLVGELKWLEHLLQSRQINPQTMHQNFQRFRTNLSMGLSPEDAAVVLSLYDQAVEKLI
ncbi:MAG: hypothetical protein WCS37_02540 [Chloroflexota bacterium]|nr:hypothetical protein [Chloroflexota bacterium]